MRPLKLVMQAYGSYPERIEIPFDKLGEKNIFLISGVTGSGKTTIFDAICFALFNKSSGSLRGNETFRSHFASDNIESFVEFEFLFNGEKYKIKRMPSYLRKKQRGTGNIQESSKVELYLPNNKIICNSKEADDYIVELLGVNDSQFCQIALLAQGEFLKLLNASTQERSEIFRNIFKTKDFQLLQLKLKDEAIKYKNDYDKLKDSILQYISQIETNDELIIQSKNKFLENQIFDDLNHFIEKVEEQNLINSDNLKNNLSESAKLNLELTNKTILCQKIKLKNELNKKLNELKNLDEIYKKEFVEIKRSFDSLEQKNKYLLFLQEELLNLNEEYKKINELNLIIDKFKTIKSRLSKTINQFNEIVVLFYQNQIFKIDQLKNKLIDTQEEFKKNDVDLKEQILLYEENYHAYLASQAGILAKELKDNEPCPVCGATLHPNPAKISNEILSKAQIDELKKIIDDKKNNLNNISNNCAILIKEIEYETKNLNDFVSKYQFDNKLPDCPNIKSIKQVTQDDILLKEKEISELNEHKASLNAQIDILEKNIKLNSINEFLEIHKSKTDEYNKISFEIKSIKEDFEKINLKKEQNLSQIALIVNQLQEYKNLSDDENEINNQILIIKEQISFINDKNEKINFFLSLNSKLITNIKEKYNLFLNISKNYSHYKILSDCANGNAKGKARIAFEQYIQSYYLDLVLFEANKHLKIMTKNQFQLMRKKDVSSLQSKTSLDIEVMDFHTFKARSAKTLSGGESFKAALSLALGLSDCISSLSGAVNIDMIFIDEGFGTLDTESLDLAMDVILNLSQTNKMVGIISHVEELKSKIENQIISIKTDNGSKIKLTF